MSQTVTSCRYMCEQCSQEFENMDYFVRHACTLQGTKATCDAEFDKISKAAIETVVKKLRPNKPGVQQTLHCINKSQSHDSFVKSHIKSLAAQNRGFFIEKEVRGNFYACRCDRSSRPSGHSTGLPSKTRANNCNAYLSFKFYPMLNVDVCVVRLYDVHKGHDLADSDHYRANRIDPDLVVALESWAEGGVKASQMLGKSVEWAYAHGFRDILDRRYFLSMSDVKYIWQRTLKRLRRQEIDLAENTDRNDCPIRSKKARRSHISALDNNISVIPSDNMEEEEEIVTESQAEMPECISENLINRVDMDEGGCENHDCEGDADKNNDNFTIISKLMLNNKNRKAPTVTVTKDEIRRRVEKPEMMTPNTLRAYLHVGHQRIKFIKDYLTKHKLQANTSTKHTTVFSSIPEADSVLLAESYKNLAMQYIPLDKVIKHHTSTIEYSSPSTEEWINTLTSARTILTTITDSCIKYSQNFDLITHGFGARTLANSASIIEVLIDKEIESLRSAAPTEETVFVVQGSEETSATETDDISELHHSPDSIHDSDDGARFPVVISDELAMAPSTVPAESENATSKKMLKEMMSYMEKMEERLEKRVLNAIQTSSKTPPLETSPVHVQQQSSRTISQTSSSSNKITDSNVSRLSTTLQHVTSAVHSENNAPGPPDHALRFSFPISVTLTAAQTSSETPPVSKPFTLNIIPTTMKAMDESDKTLNKRSKDVT